MKNSAKAIALDSDRLHLQAFRHWMRDELNPARLLTVLETERWWDLKYWLGQTFTLNRELRAELKLRIAEVIWAQGGEFRTPRLVVRSDGREFTVHLAGLCRHDPDHVQAPL